MNLSRFKPTMPWRLASWLQRSYVRNNPMSASFGQQRKGQWQRNINSSNSSEDHTAYLTTKWRGGGYICPPPANFFCLELFDWFFFEAVGNMVPSLGKLWRMSNLLFNKRYFRKALFFTLPPPTLGSVSQTTHAWKFCQANIHLTPKQRNPLSRLSRF